MDAKSVGYVIAELRKKNNMTQAELSDRLNVSDKTVSKWENGLGYPEITQFPEIAKIFGVSVDYLMTGERKGIALAGNILTDNVKTVNDYPKQGMLANILSVSRSVGGCVPNTAIDIAKIDRSVPLYALGKIGDDEHGRYVISKLQKYGIDTGKIAVSAKSTTSFSDVMSLPTGERTFFHARGANAEFSPDDIDLSSLSARMLHIGYILLLDSFDKPDPEYGTVMARFLHGVKERGIETSIDMVSDSTADYKKAIVPALKYTDYAIINEIECCGIWGLEPYKGDGVLDIPTVKKAMTLTAECGVSKKVIVHAKSAGICLDVKSGEFTAVGSLKLPQSAVKGSVGAGDAFCAGCLYGLYEGFDDKSLLEFASAAAACNLFSENSIDGMKTKNEIIEISNKYKRVKL